MIEVFTEGSIDDDWDLLGFNLVETRGRIGNVSSAGESLIRMDDELGAIRSGREVAEKKSCPSPLSTWENSSLFFSADAAGCEIAPGPSVSGQCKCRLLD